MQESAKHLHTRTMLYESVFRYDPSDGTFTVPTGFGGLYYFSTYLQTGAGEYNRLNIRVNGQILCSAVGDNNDNGSLDLPQATCSGLAQLTEGMYSYTVATN